MEDKKPPHEYWAHGQSIRLCDATTGHTVRDVAFCYSPECAEVFARMLNEHQLHRPGFAEKNGVLQP
jgi:hypothetical protein